MNKIASLVLALSFSITFGQNAAQAEGLKFDQEVATKLSLLVEQKKYDAALDLLTRAINYSDRNEARVLRARAHLGLGNTGKAREDLVHVVEDISKNTDADDQDKEVLSQSKEHLKTIK